MLAFMIKEFFFRDSLSIQRGLGIHASSTLVQIPHDNTRDPTFRPTTAMH